MSHSCCSRPRTPHVIPLDLPSSARISSRLLEVPPSLNLDLRALIKDLGNRQEELFRKLLEQQRHIESQLSSMQSTSKANTEAQQDFSREFHKFFSRPEALDLARNVQAELDGVAQSGTGEFVGEMSSETREAAAESGAAPCPVATAESGSAPSCQSNSLPAGLPNHFPEDGNVIVNPKLGKELGKGRSSQTVNMPRVGKNSQAALKFHKRHTISLDGGAGLQSYLNYLLKCKEFEFIIALAIILNACIMCWESQYQGLGVGYNLKYPGRELDNEVVWAGAKLTFHCTDWFFGVLFCFEMLVKLLCWRLGYFYDCGGPVMDQKEERQSLIFAALQKRDGRIKSCCKYHLSRMQGWNLLDCFSVVAFLFDKMAAVSFSAINPQMLRLLRLFRLFRLIRLLRFLETLDHLYVMTTAISGLSKVLIWAVVLLTLMLLICNLCLVQILQVTYFDQVTAADLDKDSLYRHHQVYQYFGTCTRCMLSMFEITLGNWPPIARLLAEEVSEWFSLVCILHKLTIGFAVVGVITGVILQETFKVAQTDDIIMFRQKKTANHILSEKMKSLFETLDIDPDGKLDGTEFKAIGDDPAIRLWLSSLDIETDDLDTLFQLLDIDGSGYITVDELVARIPRIRGAARSIDVLALLRKFMNEVLAHPAHPTCSGSAVTVRPGVQQ